MIEIILAVPLFLGVSVFFYFHFFNRFNGPITDHFNGRNFYNKGVEPQTFFQVLKWMATRRPVPWPKSRPVDCHGDLQERHAGLTITFVNHATFLIQWNGINILTDPIWSERASPFKNAGPKRVHPPGIPFEKLPPVDLVLISHNHYDSLDIPTLKRLGEKDAPLVLVGLGVKKFLESKNIGNVQELDWWQQAKTPFDKEVFFTPAQHFSARGLLDQNRTLWGGFVLKQGEDVLYYSGDTAYCQFFKQIKERFGPPRLAFLPIGAYEPRWFLKKAHMSPDEAVQAHVDLQAENSVAYHFGTFPLADEGIDEPPKRLNEEMKKRRLPQTSFWIMRPGQMREVS